MLENFLIIKRTVMTNNFYFNTENCVVQGVVLEKYPGSVRRAYSTFAEAKFECSKGTIPNT